MRVLSLFDGIAGGRLALIRAGIHIDEYLSSEIDKYANKVVSARFPHIKNLGDVRNIHIDNVDLLIGGFPCQSLSIASANKRSGLEYGQSILFWEFLRVLKETKPRYFIAENVASAKRADKDRISKELGVGFTEINSALVSAQNRKRVYWVGKRIGDTYAQIPISQPPDKNIMLKDILEDNNKYILTIPRGTNNGGIKQGKSPTLTSSSWQTNNFVVIPKTKGGQIGYIRANSMGQRIYDIDGKSITLSANGGGWGAKTGLYMHNCNVRRLSPTECEALQTFPKNFTEAGVSETQRYKMLGNAFTVDVIAHILRQAL